MAQSPPISFRERQRPRLLILGASVRAAAESARRAGFDPLGIDLFADTDLSAVCETVRVSADRYPDGLFAAAAAAPPGPWMYTGGLENCPDQLDGLAASRPLWGCPGSVVRRVRDPQQLSSALRSAGLAFPDCRASPDGLPTDGSWLIKPTAGSGGRGVAEWRGQARPPRPSFWQQRVPGQPISAVFVGSAKFSSSTPSAGTPAAPTARLLGVTRQLIGTAELNAPGPFAWCGNVGPIRPSSALAEQLAVLGRVLVEQFGLLGLFGVDGVLGPTDTLTVVEVNPRYPASAEVLERTSDGPSAVAAHAAVWQPERRLIWSPPSQPTRLVGKAVLFAPRELTVAAADHIPLGRVRVADVPALGESLPPGSPILTVLSEADATDSANADSLDAVEAQLLRQAASLRLGVPRSAGPVVCAGCALLCDDVELVWEPLGRSAADSEQYAPRRLATPAPGGCVRATEFSAHWPRAAPTPTPPESYRRGRPVSYAQAIAAAAELLRGAQSPAVLGLTGLSVEAQRAAVRLAETLRGLLAGWPPDATRTWGHTAPDSARTWAAVRDRAELILLVGEEPSERLPRLAERLGFADKRVLALPTPPTLGELTRLRERLEMANPAPLGAILERVAAELTAVRFAHVFLDSAAVADLVLTATWQTLAARRLPSQHISVSALPGEAVNARGALEVLTWLTGSAGPVSFAGGEPMSRPQLWEADRVLTDGLTDVAVTAGLSSVSLPTAAQTALQQTARVRLSTLTESADPTAEVEFRLPGLVPWLDAHVIRADGLSLRLCGANAGLPDPAVGVLRDLTAELRTS